MLATRIERARWSWRKNRDDLFGLLGRYPGFVRAREPQPLAGQVPVFCFHGVEPRSFARQLAFLVENGYRTLAASELAAVLRGETSCPERAVVLSFDDGSRSLYTVAYPLLRRHGLRAIAFVIAGLVPDSAAPVPSLDDYEAGRVGAAELAAADWGDAPFCSWTELREMQASGVIDVQSHSLYHQRVLVGPRLVDFIHPGFDRYYGSVNVPAYRVSGEVSPDVSCGADFTRDVPLGTPVYRSEPLFRGLPEYRDDPRVRDACAEAVARGGGAGFFEDPGWRDALRAVQREAVREARHAWASPDETGRGLRADLEQVRARVEQALPGHRVRHFCLPWYAGSAAALEAVRDCGYASVYWGFAGGRLNRPGDDPLRIARLSERYLERLPGRSRRPLSTCVRAALDPRLR